MIAQDVPCRVVNVASVAGLISGGSFGIYRMTKHAVVSLSETLSGDLSKRESQVKVSVVCPTWVQTRILEAERNRPAGLCPDVDVPGHTKTEAVPTEIRAAVEAGFTPEFVAEKVFDGVRQGRFYIIITDAVRSRIQQWTEAILRASDPA